MLRRYLGFVVLGVLAAGLPAANASVTVTVPGTANPWLAGMPDGSVAGASTTYDYAGDTAPAESPVQVEGIPVYGGEVLTFSATGTVDHQGGAAGPDGESDQVVSLSDGAVNGMADINAPFDALLGVFLDDNQPSLFSPPSALDFSTQTEQDFLSLSPELRQPFFIGDGLTSGNVVQQFVVPAGATRLFLGPMDDYQWANNTGSFSVTVTTLPEPAAAWMLGIGCLPLLRRRGT